MRKKTTRRATNGEEALESLRDGNGPAALLVFARNQWMAGKEALALQYLWRGIQHLQSVVAGTKARAVREQVGKQIATCLREVQVVAARIGDEESIARVVESSAPADGPAVSAFSACELWERGHREAALRWYEKGRALASDRGALEEHLCRFGLGELRLAVELNMDPPDGLLSLLERALERDLARARAEVEAGGSLSEPLPPGVSPQDALEYKEADLQEVRRTFKRPIG